MRTLTLSTTRREEFLDITAEVASVLNALLRESGLAEGLTEGALLVYSPHTTAGITINEGADPDVRRDMLAHLAHLVPLGGANQPGFRHAEGNSDAHIKTSLMGPSQLVPVSGGRLELGTWQKIYFCEFDGPRRRTVLVQFLPAASPSGPAKDSR
jgi:secondary thiamine-phosphate synthase enzyme